MPRVTAENGPRPIGPSCRSQVAPAYPESNRSKLGIEDAERARVAAYGARGKRLTYRRIDAA
jgi:hypothetical protein